jgi:hypothetical protein
MAEDKHMAKPPKRQSVVTGSSGYATNCTTGFHKPGSAHQIHHIMSLTCLAKRQKDYKKDATKYIEDCLYCAKWDINDGHNLIGLPLNAQYRTSDGRIPKNLPSHQVDHNTGNGYTKVVSAYLKENVWDQLSKKDKIHKIDVQDIVSNLKNASTAWRNKLKAFGLRNQGTLYSWKNRFKKGEESKWYKPFSMSPTPNPRSPGINLSNLSNIFKKMFG